MRLPSCAFKHGKPPADLLTWRKLEIGHRHLPSSGNREFCQCPLLVDVAAGDPIQDLVKGEIFLPKRRAIGAFSYRCNPIPPS
jgi:hypothetical protein